MGNGSGHYHSGLFVTAANQPKSVYTADAVFFLSTYPDDAPSETHKTWVWDAKEEIYREGTDREDVFVFKWSMAGRLEAYEGRQQTMLEELMEAKDVSDAQAHELANRALELDRARQAAEAGSLAKSQFLANDGLRACCPTLQDRDDSFTSKDLLRGGW